MTEQPPLTPLPEPDPQHRPARLALYLGAALLVAGAIVMFIGYNGVATNAVPQAQTPYLLSGGLLGVALMVLGGIGLGVHVLLQVTADFRAELGGMRETMDGLADTLSRQAAAGLLEAQGASANGFVMVAQGGSSFHRQTCRLVVDGQHVRPVARSEAEHSGLVPCRICRP